VKDTQSLFPLADSKLCYVEYQWAYFTTQPVEKQWGDDWNDAPYEHNAGEPYEWRPYMGERGIEPYEIARVAWRGGGDLETPADLNPPNSSYSVEQINGRQVAWLTDPGYGTRPRVSTPVVWAGTTLRDFVRIIEARGGTIYVPRSWGAIRPDPNPRMEPVEIEDGLGV